MSRDGPPEPGLGIAGKAAMFGSLCGIGGLCGLLLMPEPQAHAARPVELAVASEPLRAASDLSAQAAAVAQRYLGGTIALHSGTSELRVRRADLGVRVDLDHLQALLRGAGDATSALRRVHDAVLAGEPLVLPMPAQLDTERTTALLMRMKDTLDRAPADAHIDARKKAAVAARPGIALDVYGSLERIDRALVHGDARVELATLAIPAQRNVDRFEHVDMRAVLGEFTTRYNRGPDAQNRVHNLHVAGEKIDGYVLEPGQVFDFNAVVGDRTLQAGFKMAPEIADGKLVEGVGGGTCQIASTLHAAVFFAGLPILTRYPHSHPSYYIKLGLDATVVYGSLNFRFQNDRPYPIVVEMSVEDGFVRAALHGPERSHSVTFLRRVDQVMPFQEKTVQDPSLPRAMRVLQQRGIPGFQITSFRVITDEHTHVARRERATDMYPPTSQIWRIGSGGEPAADFRPPKNDAHPEYVADEFMIATQGPHTDGIEVTSTPGRTGNYGWTEREKMLRPKPGGVANTPAPAAASTTSASAPPAAAGTPSPAPQG